MVTQLRERTVSDVHVSLKWRATLAAMLFAAPVIAGAQTPQQTFARGPASADLPGDSVERAMAIESQGLNSPALRLTTGQRVEIDRLVRAHVEEKRKLSERFPAVSGARPGREAAAAQEAALASYTTAISKVLNEEQRRTWEAVRAAREAKARRGMPSD